MSNWTLQGSENQNGNFSGRFQTALCSCLHGGRSGLRRAAVGSVWHVAVISLRAVLEQNQVLLLRCTLRQHLGTFTSRESGRSQLNGAETRYENS